MGNIYQSQSSLRKLFTTIILFAVLINVKFVLQGRIVVHPVPPYALCWASGYIIAAGCDYTVQFYDLNGRSSRQFDYSPTGGCHDQKEFTVACCSPSGQAAVLGSFNRLEIY